ncbi:5a78893d-77e9-4957-9b69-613c3515da26 [Sclerotinia trifoliorum]|uniref:5a78893d-77e9-4957-9b69-613c3515da26 n=1 Tax=Sclerotinia trifoliorum TaxID=28548 RepID=A0A8H2VPL3_9HELO|nr:5a78893d-77e9-4957-9b69-613c3515da26 [Sclerotinia trifoliorum]
MAWISRGQSGFVQDTPNGHTSAVPAMATHRGSLWCLWSDPSGDLYYAIGDNDTFQTRVRFPDQGIPVMAELLGRLHAVIVRADGEIGHYEYNDAEKDWDVPTILDKGPGLWTNTTPALMSHNNNLILVYIQNSYLYYSTWTLDSENKPIWKYPQEVSGISKVSGIPALFVLNGDLHVLCSSLDEDHTILGFKYSLPEDVWNSCDDVSEGKAAQGVSATSYGGSAFLAFQENGPGDTSHVIYMSEYKDGMWHPQEAIADQASFDPPQLAVLNGRINCIFNSNDEDRKLLWYSRSLLDYSLDSWMAEIPDDTLLSNMTIPGTHDSCAESNIPFVRTQYLSIKSQLIAGLRFLDLRVRVHTEDGQLYMYHGGIPINMPFYLKFDFVMQEVFDFLSQHSQETVLISINNDDTSGKEPPSVFYSAVAKHITSAPPYPFGEPRWLTSNAPSTLGDARGKAVLLRRYKCEEDLAPEEKMGLDLSGWTNGNIRIEFR